MTPEQAKAHDAAHVAFSAAAGERIIGGGELEPAPAATTLRADPAGGLITTDGPFLETKEGLGGYYLLATTAQITGDFDLAEECAQEAYARPAAVPVAVPGRTARPGRGDRLARLPRGRQRSGAPVPRTPVGRALRGLTSAAPAAAAPCALIADSGVWCRKRTNAVPQNSA